MKITSISKLIEVAKDQGWTVRVLRSQHVQLIPSDPEQRIIVVPSTPSGYETLRNKIAQARRSGLEV